MAITPIHVPNNNILYHIHWHFMCYGSQTWSVKSTIIPRGLFKTSVAFVTFHFSVTKANLSGRLYNTIRGSPTSFLSFSRTTERTTCNLAN